MKACPFCAEQIQEAAIKCRYCGSMLVGTGVSPGLEIPNEPHSVDDLLKPSEPGRETPSLAGWQIGMLAAGAAILVVGLLLIGRARTGAPPEASPAATAPRSSGEPFRFAALRWGTPINEVTAQLASRGFAYSEQDEEGDHVFSGSVDGRDAVVIAMLARGALAKVIVVVPAQGGTDAAFAETVKRLTAAYGPPATSPERRSGAGGRPLATWGPHPDTLGDTRLWVTVTDTGDVATHYESGQWPAESERRRQNQRTRQNGDGPLLGDLSRRAVLSATHGRR